MWNIILCHPVCQREPQENSPFPNMVGPQFLAPPPRGERHHGKGQQWEGLSTLYPWDIHGTLRELEQKPFVPRAESRTCWVDGEAQTSVNGGAWPVDLPPAAHSKPSDPSDAQQVEGSQVRLRGVRWRVKRASKCHQGLDGIQPTPQ